MGAEADGVPHPEVRLGGLEGSPLLLALGEAKQAVPIPAETRSPSIGWRGLAASIRGAIREAITGFFLTVAESDIFPLENH